MKYIIFVDFAGKEIPVIFPERILHEEMREQVPYSEVVAAGYVHLDSSGFSCSGESKELRVVSRSIDQSIIAEHFSWSEENKSG